MSTAQVGAQPPARPAIAELYGRWTLDVVPAVGIACAALCRDNPQEFKNVPLKVLETLADLRYRTGHDSVYLDDPSRKMLIGPILGDTDGGRGSERSGAFHASAQALRGRAKDFVQRVYDTGEEQLRDAFKDAATTFIKYLRTVDGNIVADATKRYRIHFAAVVTVLSTSQFAAGLGLPPAPAAPWPLDKSWDGDGAMLIHAVLRRTQSAGGPPALTDEAFLQLQRIASYGTETIELVLTTDIEKEADKAIGSAYRWWTAIAEYAGAPGMLGMSGSPVR